MTDELLTPAGGFCPNRDCHDYGKVDQGNLIGWGYNEHGTPRRYCKTCGKTFAITRGTIFFRKRHSRKDILESLAMLAERMSISGIARVKDVKEETVLNWLRQAVQHTEAIEKVLMADYHLTRAQIDALWTYVGHKGEKGGTRKRVSAVPSGVGH